MMAWQGNKMDLDQVPLLLQNKAVQVTTANKGSWLRSILLPWQEYWKTDYEYSGNEHKNYRYMQI